MPLIAESTVAGRPSTATSLSPGRRTPYAGGWPASITPTLVVALTVCTDGSRRESSTAPLSVPAESTPQNSTNAIKMFTPGPARITTIRFHGGWL